MTNLKTVFLFEFKNLIRKKSLIIATVILCVISLGITFVPGVMSMFGGSDSANDVPAETSVLSGYPGFVIDNQEDKEAVIQTFQLNDDQLFSSKDELSNAITSENQDIDSGFVIHSLVDYEYLVNDLSMYDTNQLIFENVMISLQTTKNLSDAGIDPAAVAAASQVTVNSSVDILGKNSTQGFAIAYIYMFAMYMLILLYGTNVSTSVAREKDSRTMELLITSTKPVVLIIGKVFAAGLTGLIQVVSVIACAVIGVIINFSSYPEFLQQMLAMSVSLQNLFVFGLFGFCGYMLYLFVYAAFGSLVSKVEDVSSAVAPITYLFVFAFIIASMSITAPDMSIVKVSSYIPFVSLFTLPIRNMMLSISWIEIIASLLILIVTTVIIAQFSIYIYRLGSLNYGNKLKLKDVFKSLKKHD